MTDEQRLRRAQLRVRTVARVDDVAGQDTLEMSPEERVGMMWELAQSAWVPPTKPPMPNTDSSDMLCELYIVGVEHVIVGGRLEPSRSISRSLPDDVDRQTTMARRNRP